MKISTSMLAACTLGLMASGCMTQQNTPLSVSTDQNSPVRMHIYEMPDPACLHQILLLPPLGINNPELRDRMQQTLYAAAQRRFTVPVRMVKAESSYAPYIKADNLIRTDGSYNLEEISILGNLMNTVYVICPNIRDLKPYHPQRIDIQMMVFDAGKSKISAELSCVFNAQDSDIFNYFLQYARDHKMPGEHKDDLAFHIKSPAAFQAFMADLCSSVMAEKLPF